MKLLTKLWLYLAKKLDPEWIDSEDGTIFIQGHDPGIGQLRVVGNFSKILKNKNDPTREITLKEAYEVVFGKGTSTFILKKTKRWYKNWVIYSEEQHRIAGITSKGRAILVVITPRDNGFEKRVITSWPLSKKSKELKKLLQDCPQLQGKIKYP